MKAMKKVFNYTSAIILAIAVLISCDDFLDVNTDPTRLKDAQLTQVIAAAETSLAFNMGADIFLYSSIFSQQATGQGVSTAQTREYDKYIVTNTDVNTAFQNFYAVELADLDYAQKLALANGNPQHAGIAKVLKAFTYSALVDAWGDVPYKESLDGVKNVQPHYDNSQEIYDSLFVLINDAIVNLGQPNFLTVGSEDLIYGGDMTKWKKFANTLKLRLALHYAKVDNGAKLNSILANTPAADFFTSNADNFQMAFENVTNRQNPIHAFELARADYYAASDFMITMMKGKSDPRLFAYFTSSSYSASNTSIANYKGTVPGDITTAPYSRVYTYIRGSIVSDNGARTAGGGVTATAITYTGAAPIRMFTFAEYNFIRAEAELVYGGTSTNAATYFQAGLDASLALASASVSTAQASAYATQASAYSTAQAALPLTLQRLIEEKYVANFGVGLEPWTDWRRTGFPVLSPSPSAVTNGNTTIPRVLVYPLSEQQVNLDNVPERVSMTVKSIFWDK
jgi:hypothetical protein